MEYHITNFPSGQDRDFNVKKGELEIKVLRERMLRELPLVIVDGKYAYEVMNKGFTVERH